MSLVRNIAVFAGTLGVSATVLTGTSITFVEQSVDAVYQETIDNERLTNMTDFWNVYSEIGRSPSVTTDNGFKKCIILDPSEPPVCVEIPSTFLFEIEEE
jgi:hypothetical protein